LFDEANEIKSLIKRPYQNLSPINRIALEKLSLKNSKFYKEYVSSHSKHFCHPAISPILIAAISFFNTCKELKIAQTTNNVSNDVNKEKKVNKQTSKQTEKQTCSAHMSTISQEPISYLCWDIENTSWKVLAYGIYARVVDVSEIERVSTAHE